MKRIIYDKSGMALATVIGMMAVTAVFVTALFTFSRQELVFSTMDRDRTRAEYIAKAGVEIAAKSFPELSGSFDMTLATPVVSKLYLHYDDSGEPIINSDPQKNGKDCEGEVEITVKRGERTVNEQKIEVWEYKSVAQVGDMIGKDSGYCAPVSYTKKLGWINTNGMINEGVRGVSKDGEFEMGSLGGFFSRLLNMIFGGGKTSVDLYTASHPGVIVFNRENEKTSTGEEIKDSTSIIFPAKSRNDEAAYLFTAQAIVVDQDIYLQNEKNRLNTIAFAGKTLIFNGEIHMYAPMLGNPNVGDMVLINETGQKCTVYFSKPVYVHRGRSKVKIFEAGSTYEFEKTIDLLGYAYDTNAVIRGWLYGNTGGDAGYIESDMSIPATVIPKPTITSMTRVIWD